MAGSLRRARAWYRLRPRGAGARSAGRELQGRMLEGHEQRGGVRTRIETYTIITTAASAAVAPIHDRMPVVLAAVVMIV